MSLTETIGAIMTSGNIMEEMRQLCDVIGKRPVGSEGERKAMEYMVERLKLFGLDDVKAEPFISPCWKRGKTSARLVAPVERPLSVLALPYNRSCRVRAGVIWAPFQTAEEFKQYAPLLKGKICLTPGQSVTALGQGVLQRSERIRLAYEAGAAAFLWVSNWPGNVLPTGSMSAEIAKTMPALGITQEDAFMIKRFLQQDGRETLVELETENEVIETTSWNVSGEIPGAKAASPLVLLTAHYDSHDVTEGAFDDAAGCAIVLEAARVLSKHYARTGCRIRFVLFSSEEIGLNGSRAYVQAHAAELPAIRLLLNLDGLGAVPSSKYIHVPIGADVADYMRGIYRRFGYDVTVDNAIFLNWDHAPFALEGVPVGSLTAMWPMGTKIHFGHTPADSLDKIDAQDMRYSACCATLLVYQAAVEDDWPIRRRTPEEVMELLAASGKANPAEFYFDGKSS